MTEPVYYLDYAEAVTLHILLMRRLGETRFGAFDRALVESALVRPQHAAQYENADLIRQVALFASAHFASPHDGQVRLTIDWTSEDDQHLLVISGGRATCAADFLAG